MEKFNTVLKVTAVVVSLVGGVVSILSESMEKTNTIKALVKENRGK